MKIKDLFGPLRIKKGIEDLIVKGISQDTRTLKDNELFFIIEGDNFDIFSFLKGVEKKCLAFVADIEKKDLVNSIIKKKPVIFVKDIEREFKKCVDRVYPLKMEDFKFIGVTGTNGKTTTTHLIYHLLDNLQVKCALIGTIHYLIGSKKIKAFYTTPDYLSLRKLFYEVKKREINYIILEVSSHSIDQKRIEGIKFNQCIFTNLSRDHLDYHKNLKEYFSVKKTFFLKNPQATSIINIDDNFGKIIFSELKGERYSYAILGDADYRAINCKLSKDYVEFFLEKKNNRLRFKVKSFLLGRYNILNVLSSFACLDNLGFPLKDVVSLVSSFKSVEGRLERVAPEVFVDYAHSPDALKNVLITLKEAGFCEIIVVFGCGGNRDKGKRKIMGEIASQLATFSFITSDNPRDEEPLDICNHIRKGFKNNNFKIIIDRKKAIQEALKLKSYYRNSALLVAGKGHEDYQVIKGKKKPFKDKGVIEDIFKNKKENVLSSFLPFK